MKIKEILTQEEMNRCQKWGVLWNVDDIEMELARHYPEMELRDFIEYRKLCELEDIKAELIRFNEREEM